LKNNKFSLPPKPPKIVHKIKKPPIYIWCYAEMSEVIRKRTKILNFMNLKVFHRFLENIVLKI